jgi:uncharacterized membrane protein YphA (DoxX/SURF4 family)
MNQRHDIIVERKMFVYLAIYSDVALLILRLLFGGLLIARGFTKLRTPKRRALGVLEFFGGIAIVAGLATHLIAAVFAIEFLATAIWKIARKKPLVGGWDLDILALGIALVLTTIGAGMHSVDRWLFLFPYGF